MKRIAKVHLTSARHTAKEAKNFFAYYDRNENGEFILFTPFQEFQSAITPIQIFLKDNKIELPWDSYRVPVKRENELCNLSGYSLCLNIANNEISRANWDIFKSLYIIDVEQTFSPENLIDIKTSYEDVKTAVSDNGGMFAFMASQDQLQPQRYRARIMEVLRFIRNIGYTKIAVVGTVRASMNIWEALADNIRFQESIWYKDMEIKLQDVVWGTEEFSSLPGAGQLFDHRIAFQCRETGKYLAIIELQN